MNTINKLYSKRASRTFFGFTEDAGDLIDAEFDTDNQVSDYKQLQRDLNRSYGERVYSSDDF